MDVEVVPVEDICAAEGVVTLVQVAVEAACAQRLRIDPYGVGVAHGEDPAEGGRGLPVAVDLVCGYAVKRGLGRLHHHLRNLGVGKESGAVAHAVVERLARNVELCRGGCGQKQGGCCEQ